MSGTSWAEDTTAVLVGWLRGQVNKAGLTGAVLGLSGGVDSAVVAALAARAFPESTLAIIMPCHSDPDDARLAREAASALGVPRIEVKLDEVFDLLAQLLAGGEEVVLERTGHRPSAMDSARLASSNIKPRLRMITLYYYANLMRRLVVGTGNEVELTLGYFTKYGDGGVDLLPLGGLVKREVYKLARYLDIPQEIIDRPPSAGLWPGQTDEAELGLSYATVDRYLRGEAVSPGAVETIERLRLTSEHKRRMAPVAPVIPCAERSGE